MPEILNSLSGWLQTHSSIAYLFVFIVALGESLAVVGLIVPGAVLMVIFGALIATGHFDFTPVVITACLGAIVGDTLSYWLGKHYQQQLVSLWPLSRYPELIEKGQTFFQRHGNKSILLGRFIGPIRPVIPAIAGTMNMPFAQFAMVNIFSAILWAPLYLLPGILLGSSLEMASELAGRFALLLILLLFFLWLSYQAIHHLYKFITPYSDRFLFMAMNWNRKHPVMGKVSAALIDPRQGETRGLTVIFTMLITSSFLLALLTDYTSKLAILRNINQLVFNAFSDIGSPPFDWVMTWVGQMGETGFIAAIVIGLSIWLLWHKNWIAVAYLFAALLTPYLFIYVFSLFKGLPQTPVSTLIHQPGVPSINTAISLSTYGFIAIMLAGHLAATNRFIIYLLVTWLVSLIALGQLYFSSYYLGDVIGGLLLGLAWLCVLAIAFRQHKRDANIFIQRSGLLLLLVVMLVASYPYHVNYQVYSKPSFSPMYVMPENAWLDTGWQTLPVTREDIRSRNKHPFNLQITGKLDKLKQQLISDGWHQANNNALRFAQWFNPVSTLDELPLLPQVHEGRFDYLRLYKKIADQNALLVIRLWASDTLVMDEGKKQTLWVGNVSMVQEKQVALVQYLYTGMAFNQALEKLLSNSDTLPLQALATKQHNEYRLLLARLKD